MVSKISKGLLKTARRNGIYRGLLNSRLKMGWSKKRASTEPIGKNRHRIVKKHKVCINGRKMKMTIKEAAEMLGTSYSNLINYKLSNSSEYRKISLNTAIKKYMKNHNIAEKDTMSHCCSAIVIDGVCMSCREHCMLSLIHI